MRVGIPAPFRGQGRGVQGFEVPCQVVLSGNQQWEMYHRLYQRVLGKWRSGGSPRRRKAQGNVHQERAGMPTRECRKPACIYAAGEVTVITW